MTLCPSDERLASLLDERLDGDELVEVETHLQACERCQQTLEELTYERFSAAEWQVDNQTSESGSAQEPANSSPPSSLKPSPLLDPVVLAEQDSRRKRMILEMSPRHPSSFQVLPADKRDSPGESSSYPPQVDGYDIVGRLGRGGMGVVYRARQRGLDRLVALKMLRGGDHADPEALARFRIEVRAVARLRHHNVVQVFDVGESQGLPFVALELLEGGSLEAKNGGTPQSEEDAATLVATLARAIASAHQVGIVHRDLKPANVLFTRDGIAKITDFGLAKRLDEDDGQTHSGQVMGSPSFMAPEQARGLADEIGPASDIYSLGAILYEMITGRPPFKGGSPLETLHQVVHVEPVPPSRLRPGLSRDLETICLKCLSKEPSQRYGTAELLADDLDRFLLGAPIEARRVHAIERSWKWARREPVAASLVAVVAAVLCVGAGLGVRTLQAELLRSAEISGRLNSGPQVLLRAAELAHNRQWSDSRDAIKQLLQELGDEPRLADLRRQAAQLYDEVKASEAKEARQSVAQARLEKFRGLLRVAQLSDAHWLMSTNQIGGDPRPVRTATEQALALIGQLDSTDQGEIDLARRELILLGVEATGQPGPGEEPVAQARLALATLDRAEGDRPLSKASLTLRARLLARLGETEQAAKVRHQAEAAVAVDALDRIAAGRSSHLAGDWPRAIAEFEAALLVDPNQFRAQLDLAICQLLAGNPNAARIGLTVCLQTHLQSFDLLLLRGIASGEEASDLLRRAKLNQITTGRAEADRLFGAAEADFATASRLGLKDQQRLLLLLDRGIVRFRAARFADAEADFAEAVRLDPEHLAARVNLGQVLSRLGRTEQAVAEFDRAIALHPTDPRLYQARATARVDRVASVDGSTLDRAISDLDEAIHKERPGSADLAADHAQRARLQFRAGRFVAALADADESLRLKGDQADVSLVRIQALLELKRTAEVVQACDAALARRPTSPELWELRGVARSDRQDFPSAVGDFTQALTLDPNRASARIRRGWAYLISEATKLALADFQAVIEQDPGNADALGGRGFALALTGQHRAAVADAEESLRKARKDDPRPQYNAARIYARCAEMTTGGSTAKRSSSMVVLASTYGDRALALVRLAIESTPVERRQTFVRDVIQKDPALALIRQRPQFARSVGQTGRPTQ